MRSAADDREAEGRMKQLGSVLKRSLAFVGSAVGLGAFDALQPHQWGGVFDAVAAHIRNTLPQLAQMIPLNGDAVYQASLLMADAACAGTTLYKKRWSRARNLANFIMTIPHSVIMDFSSAWMQLKRFPLPLASREFGWRMLETRHTPWLHAIAQWIDQPSRLIPGAIQGWDLGVYCIIAYAAAQGLISLNNNLGLRKMRRTEGDSRDKAPDAAASAQLLRDFGAGANTAKSRQRA